MTEEMPRHFKFGEALGTGVNSAFINLRSEIMKNGRSRRNMRTCSSGFMLRICFNDFRR